MAKAKDQNAALTPLAEVQGEALRVRTSDIRPNRYNYNTQNEQTFAKLVESIRRFGFVEPLMVRQVRGQPGYELINGEHRFHAAQVLRLPELPITNLGYIDDTKAKQLAIILNELGGKPDEVRLADLLRDINASVDTEAMVQVLPYGQRELDMLINSVDFSFSNMSVADTRAPDKPDAEDVAEPPGQAAADPKHKRIVLTLEKREAETLSRQLATIHADPAEAVKIAVASHLAAVQGMQQAIKPRRRRATQE